MSGTRKFRRELAAVNRIRKMLGKKPLRRMPRAISVSKGGSYGASCPLGVAMGCYVGPLTVYAGPDIRYRLPMVLQRFVSNFDYGKYPELSQRPSR